MILSKATFIRRRLSGFKGTVSGVQVVFSTLLRGTCPAIQPLSRVVVPGSASVLVPPGPSTEDEEYYKCRMMKCPVFPYLCMGQKPTPPSDTWLYPQLPSQQLADIFGLTNEFYSQRTLVIARQMLS